MTKILALDTTSQACSASLLIDQQTIERFELIPRGHAERILPMIESLLAEAEVTLSQCDAIAFGRGPGAFTGVRIAASVVQGIAFGCDLPVVPISSLAAVAAQMVRLHDAEHVAVGFDARMGELYWGQYRRRDALGLELLGIESVGPADQLNICHTTDREWVGAGDGWIRYGQLLRQRLKVAEQIIECYPRAHDIASLASIEVSAGRMFTAEHAVPVYLRENVASPAAKSP